MKTKSMLKVLFLSVLMVSFVNTFSQCCGSKKSCEKKCDHSSVSTDKSTSTSNDAGLKTETFLVKGNCGMCQERIVKAAKSVKGVKKAQWNSENKMLTVSYDASKVKIDDIHNAVAKVGHDTQIAKADNTVYDKLHGCCKYDRN
jgi:copper chaperone CopZ